MSERMVVAAELPMKPERYGIDQEQCRLEAGDDLHH